jgi:hypothetical protein
MYHVFQCGRLMGDLFPELTAEVGKPFRDMFEKGDRNDSDPVRGQIKFTASENFEIIRRT